MKRNYRPTVKETGTGQPYILLEMYEDIGLGKGKIPGTGKPIEREIVLELVPETDIKQAHQIAEDLHNRFVRVRLNFP